MTTTEKEIRITDQHDPMAYCAVHGHQNAERTSDTRIQCFDCNLTATWDEDTETLVWSARLVAAWPCASQPGDVF